MPVQTIPLFLFHTFPAEVEPDPGNRPDGKRHVGKCRIISLPFKKDTDIICVNAHP